MTTQPNRSVSDDSHLDRARRRVLGVAITLIVGMPGVALAQSPRQPFVELGAQASTIGSGGQTLRLTVPLKRRMAIEVSAGAANESWSDNRTSLAHSIAEREISLHWRQTVFASRRLQVFGVLGGGRNRVKTLVYPFLRGVDHPEIRSEDSQFVAHVGSGLQVELARWVALRGDLQGIIGKRDSGLRGMAGAVIMIPRFSIPDKSTAPAPATGIPTAAQSTPPPAEWQRVKPGRTVWVTTNTGSLVHGEVTAISDNSLSIREQNRDVTILLADVRLVEGRDSVKNGASIGGVTGAVAGGVLFAGLASACEGGQECGDSSGAILGGVLIGGAIGGLLGLAVDATIPGRQTLFGGTTTVSPVITTDRKAINVTWRMR